MSRTLKTKVNTGVQTREGGGRITLIPNSSVAIVTGGYGLAILDFSDPPNTKKLKAINTGVLTVDEAGRCTIVDDKTALVVGGLGVAVLDISDPQNVSKLKKVDTGVQTREGGGRLTIVGTRALVIGGLGLAVVDFQDRANAKVLAKVDTGVLCREGAGRLKLMHDGQHALVTGGLGVCVVNIADLSQPFKVRAILRPGTDTRLKRSDTELCEATTLALKRWTELVIPPHSPASLRLNS